MQVGRFLGTVVKEHDIGEGLGMAFGQCLKFLVTGLSITVLKLKKRKDNAQKYTKEILKDERKIFQKKNQLLAFMRLVKMK